MDRALIRDALEKEHGGFILTETGTQDAFEKQLAEHEFDLVLTDFNILGYEGLQILDTVKEKKPHTPVILVTGTGSEEVAIEAMRRGASDYVIKTPAHIKRLPRTIKAVLDAKQIREERDKARQHLVESERKFRLLADFTYDWEYWLDAQGQYIYCSPSCERITGYKAEEFIKNPALLFDIVHPDYKEKVVEHYDKDNHPKLKPVEAFEFPIITRAGEECWIEHNCTSVFDELGQYLGRRGSNRDITERKRAALLQTAQHQIARAMTTAINLKELIAIVTRELSRLVDTSNFIVALYDASQNRLRPAFEADEKDVLPAQWNAEGTLSGYLINHKKSMLLRQKDIRKLIEEEKVEPIGTIPEVWLGVPLFADKSVVGVMILQCYSDAEHFDEATVSMLEVIASELGNYINKVELEAKHELLETAVTQTADMIVVTDNQGDIVYVNPAFERVSGYSLGEVLGQNPRFLKSGRQDTAFYKKLWDTITSGKFWQGQMTNRCKDGSLFTEMSTISPVVDSSGNISNYVSVKRDITQEQLLEKQMHQAQKMESIGRLAGGVAHDFNNMLAIILGYSELVLAQLDPDDKLYKEILEINKAGQRSADLTTQLLAFSRKQTIAPQVLDLNDRIGNLVKMLRRLIGEDIELILKPGSNLQKIKVDPVQIDQVLMNLCVNARDAINGTGQLIIETGQVVLDEAYCKVNTYAEPGSFVVLTVSDTGCGMDAETQSQIFEPFFTTKGLGEGTGLGLSTVYGIVKQNEGFINVYSEPGQGTTFNIYIPEYAVTETELPEEKTVALPEGHGETILLVEDEKAILDMVQSMLGQIGYSVIVASTPEEALSRARDENVHIDLLVTDVVMPGMNGKELAGQLHASFPEMKILFMSGYTSDIIARRDVLDEGVDFINKPFSRLQLAEKLWETFNKT